VPLSSPPAASAAVALSLEPTPSSAAALLLGVSALAGATLLPDTMVSVDAAAPAPANSWP